MARIKTIKSKANYTLRKRHMGTSEGTVYEHDVMTIQPMDGLFDDDEITMSDSNFKFKVGKGMNSRKKHSRGYWEKDAEGNEKWTGQSVSNEVSHESKIVHKPDYSSLQDFAYYGSAVDLVKATVMDVLLRYPGAIIKTDEAVSINGETYYMVSNETLIDIDTQFLSDKSSVENPMRYLCLSVDKYEDSNGNIPDFVVAEKQQVWCPGTIIAKSVVAGETLYTYYNNKRKYLLSKTGGNKVIIKPKDDVIEEFFNSLDNFERVLLDRDTQPLYKATFETPFATDEGNFYKMEEYVWPMINGDSYVSLDLSSAAYNSYVSRLSNMATYYDETVSDNLWRMMTHEGLKNLDWTFTPLSESYNIDSGNTEMSLDSSRLKKIIRLYGRQYDDLIGAMETLKSCERVTYDCKNNTPDYFLTDMNSNEGWIPVNTSPGETESNPIYVGSRTRGYKGDEANIAFQRWLKLNSGYIQSMKGTRHGIRLILGLFGFVEGEDYNIKENVGIATGVYPKYSDVIRWNQMKDNLDESDIYDDSLAGIAVAGVMPSGGASESDMYCIPWFDNTKQYDGNTYFQMDGGWGFSDKKIAYSLNKEVTMENTFGESLTYLKFADTIDDMLSFSNDEIKNGDICYVADSKTYPHHYFILKNKCLSQSESGWENIPETDERVIYLESIISKHEGNNPHCGFGDYDNGDKYLDRMSRVFWYACENGFFSSVDYDVYQSIEKCKYDISLKEDNAKCHYFDDTTLTSDIVSIGDDDVLNDPIYDIVYNPEGGDKKDEASANSVLNLKTLTIEFIPRMGDEQEIRYIQNVVLPYVEEMIPATTIFRYTVSEKQSAYAMDTVGDISARTVIADGVVTEDADGVLLIDNQSELINNGQIKRVDE